MWIVRVEPELCRQIRPARALTVSAWAAAPTEQLKGSIDQVIRILEDPEAQAGVEADRRRAAR